MFAQILPENPKTWIKEKPEQFGIIILRSMFALLWLSQGMIKVTDRNNDARKDHHEFLGQLEWMRDSNPYSIVSDFLDWLVIPNSDLIVWIVIFTELSIAVLLGLGLFSRLGSVLGALMTITLWLFTLGWDEWEWTYPLLFFPHILFLLAGSGKHVGLDRWVVDKTDNKLLLALT
ncbi:MAG: DoxX family protein [Candidatus Kariarchaeaceae archaeon]|jgi:uncharacterized membrane protein YphA (DoxX/SURF4 family)